MCNKPRQANLWAFPLKGSIAEWERRKATTAIRITDKRYKWLTPPWPSLARVFEKELHERISSHSEGLARRFARTREAKSLSKTVPDTYEPPRSSEELRVRIEAGESYFAGAQLDCQDLSGAALMGCNLSGGSFRNAKFQDADLSQADLSFADFSPYPGPDGPMPTDFFGARLQEADFTGANLVGAIGLEFDSNFIKDVRTSDRPTDTWSQLRNRYTAFSSFIAVLFSAVYFAPILLMLIFWSILGSAQARNPDLIKRVSDWIELLAGVSLEQCLAEECVTVWASAAAILISPQGLKFGGLAIAIFIYNVLRIRLTNYMSAWQGGARSNWTPSLADIRNVRRLDQVVRATFFFGILPVLFFTFYPILTQEVSIPTKLWPF